MEIIDNAVAPDEILDRVRAQALCDHWFDGYYDGPGFGPYAPPQGDWDKIAGWRTHLLPFDQTRQRPEYDQAYSPYRVECGSKISRTVSVVYDDRGYTATYGITLDGKLELWMD